MTQILQEALNELVRLRIIVGWVERSETQQIHHLSGSLVPSVINFTNQLAESLNRGKPKIFKP